MHLVEKTTYRLPDSLIEDTRAFRHEVEKFLSGETSRIAFRAIRVPIGIYEQRENDTYMIRVRGAAGVFLPYQVQRIAELAEEFGSSMLHATTRQDLQIHGVAIEDAPTVLEKLLEVGLSSRGGGGNTVRNVSACPYAGVCPYDVFDVTPYALALTEYLLADRANFNLPRKFKVAFSGCSKDCALCSVADLGFYAQEKAGVCGFSVYAGGGMGAHSALSVQIEEFVRAEEIFAVTEAVKRLFDNHGDRVNRHRARLRFVLARFGVDEFRRLYREELEKVRAEGISFPLMRPSLHLSPVAEAEQSTVSLALESYCEPEDPEYQDWRARSVFSQKQAGLFTVRIPIPNGNAPASAMYTLGELAAAVGDGTLRTTQDQGLQFRGVSGQKLAGLYETLRRLDVHLVAPPRFAAVACAGASTCKLGVCLSQELVKALQAELGDIDTPYDTPVRISGCPNSCGQHPIAAVGLFGTAKRVNGRLAPHYSIVAGGRVGEGTARLAEFIARVPARSVPALMKEFWSRATEVRLDGESLEDLVDRWGGQYLRELGKKYQAVPSHEDAPEFYRDFGCEDEFSVAALGPGECGAGVMDVISADIAAAKKALKDGELYDSVVAAARALLITRGIEPKKDRETFAAFAEHLIVSGWVSGKAQGLLDAAVDFRLGDRVTLNDLQEDVRALLQRVEQLFHSLDSHFRFRIDPVRDSPTDDTAAIGERVASEMDLRGVACPMNFVRAKLQLEQLESGSVLEILLDNGEPVRNVPASFSEQGEEVLSVANEGNHCRVRVRKVN